MKVLVEGSTGVIGSNVVLDWLNYSKDVVVSFDLYNFAPESHIDTSICTPGDFFETNIVGT